MARPGVWDFDPDDDFLIVDGLEELTLARLKPEGYHENPYPVRGCREVPKRNSPIPLADAVEMVWQIHAPDWPFDNILPGDKITDSQSVAWVVAEADLAGAQDQWQCRCMRQVVAKDNQST